MWSSTGLRSSTATTNRRSFTSSTTRWFRRPRSRRRSTQDARYRARARRQSPRSHLASTRRRRSRDSRHGDATTVLRTASPRRRAIMTRQARTGKTLDDAALDALAVEVENGGYDIEALKKRRSPGRPAMGSGPADVVPVRIDPELRKAIEQRAEADATTTSAVIRDALRSFLGVA